MSWNYSDKDWDSLSEPTLTKWDKINLATAAVLLWALS